MSTVLTGPLVPRHSEKPIVEGKTKQVFVSIDDPSKVVIVSKDDITAGDGAKHDIIPDKAKLATRTTCNVFKLLKACGLPVAFDYQGLADAFVAPKCAMLPFEVVVRREAHGSYCKRNPHIPKGHYFPKLVLEFFLKTKDKNWKGTTIPCDDPLIRFSEQMEDIITAKLYLPSKQVHAQESFLSVDLMEACGVSNRGLAFDRMNEMGRIAKQTFLVLEKAWQLQGGRLVDFKVEFGLDADGNLLLADVIDNDSWRVIENGVYIDKQLYRDGGALSEVAERYAQVAEQTGRFMPLPKQRIVLWKGSKSDNAHDIWDVLKSFNCNAITVTEVVCSMHKEPVRAMLELQRLVQEVPDTVVIALVGMSNGAGPTLSAATTVPVITVPASATEFPNDVWSSLRTPSNVPVMTVMNPKNAALAALNILSARNPAIYKELRYDLEARLMNVVPIAD